MELTIWKIFLFARICTYIYMCIGILGICMCVYEAREKYKNKKH